MSVITFENLIRGEEYYKAIFEEFKVDLIESNNIQRIFKRTSYKLYDLECINFPPVLLKLVEELLQNNNIEITIIETFINPNKVNYYGYIKSDLPNYKFIENIYYKVDVININNQIKIETSIDKNYDENSINEFDKFFLSILLFFIENGYTSYVKNEIFIKNMNKINLHSFELNIT
jgi:type III secretory pathway component EscV